jgi:hypothetical protein
VKRDDALSFDATLDAILALEAMWLSREGRLRLSDLGVAPLRLVRSRGHAALPPERWRSYPADRARRGSLKST